MPYSILFDQYEDITESDFSSIIGGIWVPPPSDGGKPGTPTFTGSVSVVPGEPAVLTFPGLMGPPTAPSAMLISQPSRGDFYRSGTTALPPDPVHLNGTSSPAPVLNQAALDKLTAVFPPQTIPIDGLVQAAFAALTLGFFIPTSITASAVSLTLPTASATGTLTVALTGTVAVSNWFGSTQHPFTFTESVALAPSGDPVDSSLILAATGSSANLSVIGGGIMSPLAGSVAGQVTPNLEARINQAIRSSVADVLAGLDPPQQLSPRAVISASQVVIAPSPGWTMDLSLTNIFGPALIPLDTTVPDVYGDTVPEATAAMRAAQLKIRTIDDGHPDGHTIPTVEDMSIEPGTAVPVGTEVVLTLKVHEGAGN